MLKYRVFLRMLGQYSAARRAFRGVFTNFSAKRLSHLGTVGVVLLVVIGIITACSRSERRISLNKRIIQYGQTVPKGGGVYKIGRPYKIAGQWYHPKEDPYYNRVGIASWYGDLFHGRHTANGEIFDMDALTAAHPTLPIPVYVRVTNLSNGRNLIVRVNDRGPYKHNRIIDLSRQTARLLGMERRGTGRVRVQYIGRAPLNGDDSYERRYLYAQHWMRGYNRRRYSHLKPQKRLTVASIPNKAQARPIRTQSARGPARQYRSTPTSAAPYKAGFYLQLGSFREQRNAILLRNRVSPMGPVSISPVQVAGNTYYRVTLGPYAKRGAADRAAQEMSQFGVQNARIIDRTRIAHN